MTIFVDQLYFILAGSNEKETQGKNRICEISSGHSKRNGERSSKFAKW